MLCMAEEAGLMKHDGTLNMNTIRQKITLGAKPGSSIDSHLSKCARRKENAETTSMQLWICFIQNDIHYYHRL